MTKNALTFFQLFGMVSLTPNLRKWTTQNGSPRRSIDAGTRKARCEENMKRHPGLDRAKVQKKLAAQPDKLRSLAEMERRGGERGGAL